MLYMNTETREGGREGGREGINSTTPAAYAYVIPIIVGAPPPPPPPPHSHSQPTCVNTAYRLMSLDVPPQYTNGRQYYERHSRLDRGRRDRGYILQVNSRKLLTNRIELTFVSALH